MPEIPFHLEKQEATNWCWAAIAVSVNHHFAPGSRWRQCGLVKAVLGKAPEKDRPKNPDWCAKPVPRQCNRSYYLEDALRRLGRLKRCSGPLGYREIQREIDADRPVCARIEYRDKGRSGHFVVITGYHTDHSLDIADPWYHGGKVKYQVFKTNYRNSARWTHTYLVRGGKTTCP
jgi:hypothetical protein